MRALLVLAVACAPAVQPSPVKYDEDLATKKSDVAEIAPAPPVVERAVAPIGQGARTGTIDRTHLITVLDQGPAVFLHEFDVTARMDGGRFVGCQLVQLLHHA